MGVSLRSRIRVAAVLGAVVLAACAGQAADPGPISEAPEFPPSNRPEVRGARGAVSAGHPLAVAAGHDILSEGGNATDAVVAMAGVLAVVRPHMNGVGGDAFGLFYDASSGEVEALNGSGRSGALATRQFFVDRDHEGAHMSFKEPESGTLIAAADPRREGYSLAY